MRGDLQVDKGNGVRWGLARKESGLIPENQGAEEAFTVANSKISEKQHGCPWQSSAQGCCDPGLRQAAQDYVIQQEVGWTWHRQPGLKYQLAVTNGTRVMLTCHP